MWETPPDMYMKMTRLAFPVKWGARGASGFSVLPRASSANRDWRMPGRRIDPAARERIIVRREGLGSVGIIFRITGVLPVLVYLSLRTGRKPVIRVIPRTGIRCWRRLLWRSWRGRLSSGYRWGCRP